MISPRSWAAVGVMQPDVRRTLSLVLDRLAQAVIDELLFKYLGDLGLKNALPPPASEVFPGRYPNELPEQNTSKWSRGSSSFPLPEPGCGRWPGSLATLMFLGKGGKIRAERPSKTGPLLAPDLGAQGSWPHK